MRRERIWLKVAFTARPWKIGVIMQVAKLLGNVKIEYYCGGTEEQPTINMHEFALRPEAVEAFSNSLDEHVKAAIELEGDFQRLMRAGAEQRAAQREQGGTK